MDDQMKTNGFEIRLPQAEAFSGFDLTADRSEDIEKVEKGKKDEYR